MDTCKKNTILLLVALSLTGCSGTLEQTENTNTQVFPSGPVSFAPIESLGEGTPNLQELKEGIYINPREGGVREYLIQTRGSRYSSIDGRWTSYISLKEEAIQVDWSKIQKITFIPVCNSETGKFVLYKHGKNIADGPCGPKQIIALSPPKPATDENEVFSFEITGATKAEVALYKEYKEGETD